MPSHRRIRPIAYLLCAFVLCTLYSGCARKTHFTARTLPAKWRVPPRSNPQEQSLAALGSLPRYANSIGPGDHLAVDIAPSLERNQVIPTLHVIVSDNGTIQLPQLGQVNVAGMKAETAGTAIQRDFVQNDIYRSPLVTVRIEEKRTNKVRVIGGVNRPQVYELPADQSDVLTAITMAGGLAEDAGDKIEVRTAGGVPQGMEYAAISPTGIQQAGFSQPMGTTTFAAAPVTISLSTLARGGGMGGNPDGYRLQDGAVVMVQKLDPLPISVRGLVNKPGPLAVTGKNVRLWDALTSAGGVSNQFANKVWVIRQTRQGDPITISLKLSDAKTSDRSNILLAPGDVVSVEQTPATLTLDALRMLRFGVSRLDTLF